MPDRVAEEPFSELIDAVTKAVHAAVTERYGDVTERDAVVMGLTAAETVKHLIRPNEVKC